METFMESTLRALRAARDKAGSTARLAELTGVQQVTLGRWLDGSRKPTVAELGKVFDRLGITLHEPGLDFMQFEMIPKVEAKAGAGSSFDTSGETTGLYAFRQDFLRRIGVHAEKCVMLDVMGESMQPLIMNGDTILVDTTQTTLKDGEIFLVTLGEELLVKRVQRTVRGWMLVSQNPDFAPMAVEGDDLDSFIVRGRVCWFGRVM